MFTEEIPVEAKSRIDSQNSKAILAVPQSLLETGHRDSDFGCLGEVDSSHSETCASLPDAVGFYQISIQTSKDSSVNSERGRAVYISMPSIQAQKHPKQSKPLAGYRGIAIEIDCCVYL